MSPTVLHLSPHPDDELIGAPATLMALRDAGWRVVNLACGLGGEPGERGRRAAELRQACGAAGFELLLAPQPPLGSGLDRAAERAALRTAIEAAIEETEPALVVSPGAGDRHPAHRAVAAAARAVLEDAPNGPAAAVRAWWAWALWGFPERPTLAAGFDSQRLDEILAALGAHTGELRRNDYRRLLRGRAEMSACLAPELLFGFGADADSPLPYAELLGEAVRDGDAWRPGVPRWLDPGEPLGGAPRCQ